MRTLCAASIVAAMALGCSSSSTPPASSTAKKRSDAGTKQEQPDAGTADAGHDAGHEAGPIALPDGLPGIGFDDLRWAPGIHKVLAPGGRSGKLDLVDPDSLAITSVAGFTASDAFSAGAHSSGTTSADEAGDVLLAIDHETQSLKVVDPKTLSITASADLGGGPDYVRYVAQTHEAWVTQPFNGIEIFSVPASGAPVHEDKIAIDSGPEAIVVDATRSRVYTNSFTGMTFAVDIAQRKVVESWTNGCGISLGLALDEARGFLFVACMDGTIEVLDAANAGKKLGEVMHGSGLDILSYDPNLHHLYVQGAGSSDLGIVGISASGAPSLLGSVPTAASSTSASDENGHVFVGDLGAGGLIRVRDTYPKTD